MKKENDLQIGIGGLVQPLDKSYYQKCDCPNCRHFALIRDWANWKWCIKHFIRNLRWEENKWAKLKWARINWKAFQITINQ